LCPLFRGKIRTIEKKIKTVNLDSKLERKLLIYSLKKFTTLTLKEIGVKVGGMSEVAVSQVARRLEESRKKNKDLSRTIHQLETVFCKM